MSTVRSGVPTTQTTDNWTYWASYRSSQRNEMLSVIDLEIEKSKLWDSIWECLNPNSEGVPATHLSEGGAHCAPPPGKYSINGPN